MPGVAAAQDTPGCRRISSEVTLGPLSGRRIDSVDVVTQGPALPERVPAFVSHLHVRSRPAVIRHELLFQAGDTIDTLRVAESLRRLRGLPYLQVARVVGVDCASVGDRLSDRSSRSTPVRLIVETQDGWSQAWTRFVALETPGTIAAVERSGFTLPRIRLARPGGKASGTAAIVAAALLGLGVILGIAGLFPDYFGGQSLASQADQLVPHLLYLIGWAVSGALIATHIVVSVGP